MVQIETPTSPGICASSSRNEISRELTSLVLSVCNVGVLWSNSWMDQDATWYEVGLRPCHIVLEGDPAPDTERGTAAPHFSADVYCDQTIAHLCYCSALVKMFTCVVGARSLLLCKLVLGLFSKFIF